jgi:hypothetical protein
LFIHPNQLLLLLAPAEAEAAAAAFSWSTFSCTRRRGRMRLPIMMAPVGLAEESLVSVLARLRGGEEGVLLGGAGWAWEEEEEVEGCVVGSSRLESLERMLWRLSLILLSRCWEEDGSGGVWFSLPRPSVVVSAMLGTAEEVEVARRPAPGPKKDVPRVGELRPGLRGDIAGEAPRYMLVTRLAAGQSELARRWPMLLRTELERPIGTLGAVEGSSFSLRSSGRGLDMSPEYICDCGRGRGRLPMTLFAR